MNNFLTLNPYEEKNLNFKLNMIEEKKVDDNKIKKDLIQVINK